eukprot:s2581_g9.t2
MFAWCAALRAQTHDVDGLQVREEGKVGEGGFSTIWRVRLVADRGPDDERLPTTMALKKTICQDEERLELARNEVEVLRRAGHEGRHVGREFIVQYFSHKELPCQDGGSVRTEVHLLMEWCGGGSLLPRILKDETVAVARCPNMLEEDVYFCVRCRGQVDHPHPLQCEVINLTVDTSPFAAAKSAADALRIAFQVYSQRPCLGTCPRAPQLGCNWHSYGQVGEASEALAAGIWQVLENQGKPTGQIVGLLGAISKPWFLTDFACTLAGVPLVTMHRASNEKALAHLLDQSGLTLLVASRHLAAVIQGALRLARRCQLKTLVWLEDSLEGYGPQTSQIHQGVEALGPRQMKWTDLLRLGASFPRMQVGGRNPKAIIKLLPSSGSTGLPKLVPVTEDSFFKGASPNLQCSMDVVVLMQGGRLGCSSGLGRALEDLPQLRPTTFAAPPSFWNGLHKDFEHQLRGDRQTLLDAWRERKVLGNRIAALISTGASLPHPVQRWLVRVFGKMVIDSYGCTETGGLASNGAISGTELRLRDLPQLGYLTSDRPFPRGEILAAVKSCGYFALERWEEDGTLGEEVEGDWVMYFCTGDVGERRGPGEVKEPLEALFLQSRWVSQLFLWGCSGMTSVAAVVVPSDQLREEVKKGSSCAATSQVLKDFAELGARHGLKPWEIPGKVLLEFDSFSESGMLTASGKQSRSALIQRYAQELAGETSAMAAEVTTFKGHRPSQDGLCHGLQQLLLGLGPPPFRPHDALRSLGLDSFQMGRLARAVQRQFRVEIPVNVLFSLETLGDLERVCLSGPSVLRNVLAKKQVLDFRKEAQVAHEALVHESGWKFQECLQMHPSQNVHKTSILVTGATGFLGAFVAARLAQLGHDVVCLVRAVDVDAAHGRLWKAWRDYCLDLPQCVRVLPSGGVERAELGLAEEDFALVLAKVSVIIHCAAEVSGIRPYLALREANVMGTREVLACAWRANAKVIHVSTMGFLPEGHGEVREVPTSSLIPRSGYAQSKWVAEELVWLAMESPGVPAVVVRPGTVAGHPDTGATNRQDALSILLLGLVQLGKVALGPGSPLPPGFNLVPIDFVVDSLVGLVGEGPNPSEMRMPQVTWGRVKQLKLQTPQVEVVMVLRQAALALAFLHSLGIAHYDLKPENVLFTKDGDVRLCDFGSASSRQWQDMNTETSRQTVREVELFFAHRTTPMFRPPELADPDLVRLPIGTPADVFMLGLCLYQMLFAVHAFPMEGRLANIHVRYSLPEGADNYYSPGLLATLAALLSRDPRKRPVAEELSVWGARPF